MITRRTFIKRAAQAAIVAAAAPDIFAKSSDTLNPLALNELRIPPVFSIGSAMRISPSKFKIYPGIDSDIPYSVNDSFVAPTIRVKKGNPFYAIVGNNLSEDTVIHWHGIHAPAGMDGHPRNSILKGEEWDIHFPITQRAGTFFYHSHADMNTAKQSYLGLMGMFIVEDDEEKALNLPSGEYEIPLLIQDKRFDANKQLIYAPTAQDMMSGWLGDTILINGTPDPFVSVAPTQYRLRLINGSNARIFKIGFEGLASSKEGFTIIGNDGGLLDKPVHVTSAMLSEGERLDIIVDLSGNSSGSTITLKSLPFTPSGDPGSGTLAQGAAIDLLQFQISKTGSSNFAGLPAVLSTITKYNVADIKNMRVFSFAGSQYINFKSFKIDRIDEHVPLGDLEQWTFQNQSQIVHPIHVHGLQFQVLDRGAGIDPEPAEAGWKDVIRIEPFLSANVLLRFNNPGLFLLHCHNLEHEDMGMMTNISVEQSGVVGEKSVESDSVRISPNPASDHALISFSSLEKETEIIIADERGNILLKEMLHAGAEDYKLSASHFSSGSYTVVLGKEKCVLMIVR